MLVGKKLSSAAVTMTELLIAMTIVSFMFAVIMGLEFSVRSMDRTSSIGGSLYVQTMAVAENYRKAAIKATGDFSNPGVHSFGNTTCFRQDINATATAAFYTDDTWRCFTHLGANTANVHTCSRVPGNVLPAAACGAGDPFIGLAMRSGVAFAGGEFRVTLTSRENNAAAASADNEEVVFPVRIALDAQSIN
jgi:hypothetical protein